MLRKLLVSLAGAVLLSACVDTGAVQRAVDRVDSTWAVANTDLKKTAGVRTYRIDKKTAFQAMLVTLNELGYVVQNVSFETGFILARAPIPIPLTKDEWAAVKRVEEPRMRAIAASEVGPGGAGHFRLYDSGFDTIVNVVMLERARDIRISFGFQMVRAGPVVYRDGAATAVRQQPPPEAVRYAMKKAWDHFERIALVQSKTFG